MKINLWIYVCVRALVRMHASACKDWRRCDTMRAYAIKVESGGVLPKEREHASQARAHDWSKH